MKRSLLSLVLVVLLLPVCLAGAAVDPPMIQASPEKAETTEYLIGLPPPHEPLELGDGLRDASPGQLLRAAAEQQAGPLLAELRRLQARGQIREFELDPAQFAIRVTASGELPALDETGAYAVPAEAGPPSCAAGLPAAVAQMARASAETRAMPAVVRSVTDAPTIYAGVYAPYVGEYSYVSGDTTDDISVRLRIYRNGSLYHEEYNRSDGDGYYSFYPYWDDCPQSGYNWYLQPGDVVEVTNSDSETAQTTIVPVVASLDPVSGTIEGRTAPNRNEIRGYLYTPRDNECYGDSESWYTQSAADGRFTADVGGVYNLDGRASSSVYVVDENGNMTGTGFSAFEIETETGYEGVWATVNRGASGSMRLSRGGQQIGQEPFVADERGYASVYFGQDILPGDVITVEDGKQTMTTTMAPAGFTLDAAQDRLTGTTAAGRIVRAYFYNRSDSYDAVQTSCSYQYGCGIVTAAAGGGVTIPAGFDLRPADYGYVYIYDEQGNTQYSPTMSAPALAAGAGLPYMRGYWSESYITVAVRLYDSTNALKVETSDYTSYNGEMYAWFGEQVVAGDRLEVSDGVTTRSMVIPATSGRLNSAANVLTIQGPDRPFVVAYEDYDGGYYDGVECYESEIAGGKWELPASVAPREYASALIRGADNNYAMLSLDAFTGFVTQDSNEAYFYAETPDAVATVKHSRGGNVEYQDQYTADMMGYFWISSTQDFVAGDVLEVTVDDGSGATINLTPLTAQIDPATNGVYGVGPANHEAIVRLVRQTGYNWWRWGWWTQVDAGGNYRVEFPPDLYWGGNWRQPCLNVSVEDRCVVPSIDYYTSEGHSVSLAYDPAPPALPDTYEPDNTAATAMLHMGGTRTHTLHAADDVDWVKVNIPAWAIGRPVVARALNMGWTVGVNMELFRPDGVTPVAGYTYSDMENEIYVTWKPDAAGVYLLRITPMFEESTGHCDSYYDLRIDLAQVSLPSILGR